MLPMNHMGKIAPTSISNINLLIKAAMLLFCTEYSETQVATSSD